MRDLRQAFLGIGAALLSVFLVLGSFSIAFTEGGLERVALQFTQVATPTSTQALVFTSVPLPGVTLTASPIPKEGVNIIPSETTQPEVASCSFPTGWFRITVQLDDSLDSLASAYGTTPDALSQGNCLVIDELIPGMVLHVPQMPTSTPEETCGPPPGWVFYRVQYGDTLYSISQMVGVSVFDLQLANCMVGQTNIRAGRDLFVPFLPASARTPTPTSTHIITATPTFTTAPAQVTPTPTRTPTQFTLPTRTPTPTLTPKPEDTATSTPTPTVTNSVTPTEVPTSTPTPTSTVTPSFTPETLPTETPTITPT